MIWIPKDEAKLLKAIGSEEIVKVYSSRRPSTRYEPTEWERAIASERLSFYTELAGIRRSRGESRERLTNLILSIDSICRRGRSIAFSIRKDYWLRIISDRIIKKIINGLIDNDYIVPCRIQVSKRPIVYDFTDSFKAIVPALPAGCTEGRNLADRKRDVVWIKPVPSEDGNGPYGDRSPAWEIEEVTEEMKDLNAWFLSQWHRVEGVDDPYHHRIFHHSLAWGGRIYSEFTNMDRETERPLVKIDGEETAEADLKGSYLSLFLLWRGRTALPEDVYQAGSLAGYDRKFMKEVFIRLFGRGAWWRGRLPNEIHDQKERYGYADGLPRYKDVKRDICSVYPELLEFEMHKPTLFLERYESTALIVALKWLRDIGEIGLPIHDGIRVRRNLLDSTQAMFNREIVNLFS